MDADKTVIVVPNGKSRERLDVFLTHHLSLTSAGITSRSKIQSAIKAGYIQVNGNFVKPSHLIMPGEVIHITLPKAPTPAVIPENIPLDILFEDEYLLVLNKPAGMVTHPAYGNYSGTLVNALLYYCQNHLSNLQRSSDGLPRPGIVHRLDKNTSGLMVIAKDNATHAHLSKQFERKTIEREYWTIVWGVFKIHDKKIKDKTNVSGIVEAALGRSKADRKKIAVTRNGKHAITEYLVLEEFDYLSLLRCKLRTGRTHQIRVHMHHIGHPVFGDPEYGGRRISWGGTEKKKMVEVQMLLNFMKRQALHAKTIGFIHPKTENKMTFNSPLPLDFEQVLQFLRQQK